MFLYKLIFTFCAFGVFRELIKPSGANYPSCFHHGRTALLQYIQAVVMVHAGNITTKEAQKTQSIVARLMNKPGYDVDDYKTFLSQMRTRDLNLQNIFFVVNWNVLLAVSENVTKLSKTKYIL